MKKSIIVSTSVLAVVVSGCDLNHAGGSDRNAREMYAWATEIRSKCDVVGHGIDFGHAGWWYKTDILKCPDGSMNVVPVGVPN